MCCRIVVGPLDYDLARAVLAIGQFTEESRDRWVRELGKDEQGQTMSVAATFDMSPGQPARLRLQINPSITAYAHHFERRIQAGVAFEIACKYAERVAGDILQLSNVDGCSANGVTSRPLAKYPEQHMDFAALCNGFRESWGYG